jgi:hypothetical protein
LSCSPTSTLSLPLSSSSGTGPASSCSSTSAFKDNMRKEMKANQMQKESP